MVKTNRRNRQAQPKRVRKIVNRLTIGSRIRPSNDPPEFSANPWWPLTVYDVINTDTTYTPASLHALIIGGLGLNGYERPAVKTGDKATTIEFRFRALTVRVWGVDKQPIQLAVADASGTDSSSWTNEFNDYASGINYSKLGWRFGDVFSHRVLSLSQTFTLFAVGQSKGAGKMLVIIQTLIRVPNAPDPKLVKKLFSPRAGTVLDGFEVMNI